MNIENGYPQANPVPFWAVSALVGRHRELELIRNAYEAAKGGRAHVVLVAGEPGIGKTRLLHEVSRRSAADGAVVLRGTAAEAEGMPPFLPFLEALGQHIRLTPQEQLALQVASAPGILAGLFPELAALFHVFPGLPLYPPEQTRLRLYEALGAFLTAISASSTLVCTLDDLQWADSASLDFLTYLLRHHANAHLLLIGAYREGEVDLNTGLASTIAELTRQRVLRAIRLGPLSKEEIELLAASRLGDVLSPAVGTLLHAHSEGNPFFAEELLASWVESKVLAKNHQQWEARIPLEPLLPPSIVSALRQRFAHIAAPIIDHLRVAAVIGRTFDPALLASIEQQDGEEVEERLLEAARAGLVRSDPGGCFYFTHDKIRECLYAEVSMARRRRLHETIGRLHEDLPAPDQMGRTSRLAELAFHFSRSGDQARGIHYSLRAAAQAMQTAVADEALTHYRTALALMASTDQQRGNVLLALAEACSLAGQEQEAERIFTEAEHWLAAASGPEIARRSAQAARGRGLALWRQQKRQEALAAFEAALEHLGAERCVERVKVLLDLAQLHMTSFGQQAGALSYAQQARGLACDLGDTRLEMMARRVVAEQRMLQGGDLASAAEELERVSTYTQGTGDLLEESACAFDLAVIYCWLAQVRRAHKAHLHWLALVERCQQPSQEGIASRWLVLLLASQGEWAQAKQVVKQPRPPVTNSIGPLSPTILPQAQGFLAYQQEQYAEALQALEAAQVGLDSQRDPDHMISFDGLLALVTAALNQREAALAAIARVERLLQSLPEGCVLAAPQMVCLALTAIALKDHHRARSLYRPLLAFRGQLSWFLVDRVLGQIAALSGQWELASLHLAAAERTAKREGLYPELARTLIGQAEIEIGRGGQGSARRARALLTQALRLAEGLEMADSANRVRNRLRSLNHHASSPIRSPLPGNLTEREASVLKLVAEGKSNRQIAYLLGITEKTVTNHLTHIFEKTASENRAAAAAFAIRQGLA